MDCTDFRRHHLAYVDDTLPGDVLVSAERHRVECAACGAHDTLVRRSLLLARNLPSVEPSAEFTARLEARLREVRAEGRADVAALTWSEAPWTEARWTEARWTEARWYERLVQDAGGWGRQAVAAAVVLAAVSAGYALRGGREVVGGLAAGTLATGAPAASAPVAGVSAGGAAAAPAFGAASLGTTEVVAAPAVAALRAAAGRARGARRRDGEQAAGVRDTDDLNTPAYIPLPAGAIEASALLGPASAGIPVWPAALLAGEAPTQFRAGGPSVRLVGLSH